MHKANRIIKFCRSLVRKLHEFEIRIRHLGRMHVFHEADGKRTMAFTSRYELKDGVITVKVDEYYNQIAYPLEEFEMYRSVINAAADFNKIVLILVKQ